MKSGPLSNPDVIKKVNAEFIPVEINLTDEGFPASIPALQLWQKAFEEKPSHKMGFATTVIVEPKGKYPLGTSGSGYLGEYATAINYHTDKYLKFLAEFLDRARRARELETSTKLTRAERTAKHKELTEEILRSLQEANRGVGSQGR
jgi:hypothetical protein